MKTRWTTHLWNGAIWLALSPCHMTMTCKINKLEKPGGPLSIFHTLFGRYAAFYVHFRADTVTSEWSTHISHQTYFKFSFWYVVRVFFEYLMTTGSYFCNILNVEVLKYVPIALHWHFHSQENHHQMVFILANPSIKRRKKIGTLQSAIY